MAPDAPDTFVPDPQVRKELAISETTLGRWTNDKKLGFPPIIKVFTRNYRSRKLLEEFKQRVQRVAISERSKRPAPTPPQRKQKRRA